MEALNFIVEVSIPLVLGLTASLYLKNVTTRLLLDLCGTQDRSEFWVRVTTILMSGVPLVLALAFGRSGNPDAATGEVARHALLMATLGIVLSVGAMTRMIMGSIPKATIRTEPVEVSK